MATLEQLSATLEKIYAAAADAALWPDALIAIEDFTGSTGAVIDLVPNLPAVLPRTFAGSFTEEQCAEYALNYQHICPRIAFGAANPDVPIHVDSMVLSEREMDLDPVYEWFGKHGLRYYIAANIGEVGDHWSYFSLQRTRRQGHAEQKDVELFALLRSHVARALSLATRLGTLHSQSALSLTLLNALPYAVFGLNDVGRLIFANQRAQNLLERRDGLLFDQGKLTCAVAAQQARFDRLVQTTGEDGTTVGGGWIRLRRPSGRRDFVALVAPMTPGMAGLEQTQPCTLLIVNDPDDTRTPSDEALRHLYDLTDAEARLAVALTGGHSLQSAAELLRVSPETVRFHLKNLFHKLGVNRQQDLLRMLLEVSTIGSAQIVPSRHPNG